MGTPIRVPHLVLFFTRGYSLETWEHAGILDREVSLYREYLKREWRISFVTYGGERDLQIADQLGGIEVLCNRWGLSHHQYEKYLHLLHAPSLAGADVIKTHQLDGADVALRAARFWSKPFVVRCGYLWSSVSDIRLSSGLSTTEGLRKTQEVEAGVFCHADKVILTAEVMRRYVQDRYHLPTERVQVIPNFVRTDVFKPAGTTHEPRRISCVAKLYEQKNLLNLVAACQGLGVELDLIGSGKLENDIRQLASTLNVAVKFWGNIPNDSIPQIINRSRVFALVSLVEGHPKALIEAMSCGLAVIGSNVSGIREIIQHEQNGYLCETDVQSIHSALARVLADKEMQGRLGRNARAFVEENYSLEHIFSRDLDCIQAAAATHTRPGLVRRALVRLATSASGMLSLAPLAIDALSRSLSGSEETSSHHRAPTHD